MQNLIAGAVVGVFVLISGIVVLTGLIHTAKTSPLPPPIPLEDLKEKLLDDTSQENAAAVTPIQPQDIPPIEKTGELSPGTAQTESVATSSDSNTGD